MAQGERELVRMMNEVKKEGIWSVVIKSLPDVVEDGVDVDSAKDDDNNDDIGGGGGGTGGRGRLA